MVQLREIAVPTDHKVDPDLGFVIVPARSVNTGKLENADVDSRTLFGRPYFEVERDLRIRGIFTLELEEWGGLVRAVVPNATGRLTVQFLFPDTLEAVVPEPHE